MQNCLVDKSLAYHQALRIVRHIFSSQFAPLKHVAEALKVLQILLEERSS
jgi:hypothetical protein